MSLKTDISRLRELLPPKPPPSDTERIVGCYKIGLAVLQRTAEAKPDRPEFARFAAYLAEALTLAREGIALGGPHCARRVRELLAGLYACRQEIVPGQPPVWRQRTAAEKLGDFLYDDSHVDGWRSALEADRRLAE
jgi:hypothetical protein